MNKTDKNILDILKKEFGEPQHVKAAKQLIEKGITSQYFMKCCKLKDFQKIPDDWTCNTYNSLRDHEILGHFPSNR